MDYDKTREVLAALEREGVRYVIIGAVASTSRVSRGQPRISTFLSSPRQAISTT